MPIFTIDDPRDPRLTPYRAVSEPDLARSAGFFIAEGRLVVERLLRQSRLATRSLLVTQAAFAAMEPLTAAHPDLPVFLVAQPVMNTVTGFNIHRGCLALGERPAARDWWDVSSGSGAEGQASVRLVVLENVGNADNVGSIFRSAAAFGANGVLLAPGCADPLYRKAIRTSMGASLALPFGSASPWPDMLDQLRASGIAVIGMTPASAARPLADVASTVGDRPVAVVLGHEGGGLSGEALARCDVHARIDISPGVDSLNVATAAAIALYALRSVR